jgi:peroxiredoxin
MSVATVLAPLRLADEDGVPVSLGDLWKRGPVVLLFVRHFGCVFARQQVNELKKYLPELHSRGAELVVVGNGSPEFAAAFREELAFDGTILVDPSLEAYRLAGLRRDFSAALSPRSVLNAWRALRDGYRKRKVQGDPWQQGGVFVIAPGDQVRYAYVSQVAGDHPAPSDVLEAVERAADVAA